MPWRDVPERYGSRSAVYALFRRWQRDGTWIVPLSALQAYAARRIVWDVSVDSTIAGAPAQFHHRCCASPAQHTRGRPASTIT